MSARKSPSRSNRLLVDIGTEMFGKRNELVPSAVFFNLSAYDQGRVTAGIERENDFIERSRVRRCAGTYLARCCRGTFVGPIVHGNGYEYRSHGRLHCEVVPPRNCR